MSYTPLDDIPKIHRVLHQTFLTRVTFPISWRQHQILQLARMVQENQARFADALQADLGRPALEAHLTEIGPVVERCLISARGLPEWASPEDKTPDAPDWQKPWKLSVHREPKGVIFVIAPWNYPMILSLQPLLGAIAAGCCCVVKPSEIAPVYSATLAELLPKYLDQSAFRVVCGSVEETTKLLELKWDHIFYTGNGTVARIIASAAAKHLTPLTLELGGKSPVIIDPSYPIDIAARRILWGKTSNAGQICVAPDYVLLPISAEHPNLLNDFIAGLKKAYEEFYGGNPLKSESYSKIVSSTHYKRLIELLQRTEGKVVIGGGSDTSLQKIEPTVVIVKEGDALLQNENFGPILPILQLEGGLEGAVDYIRKRDHPLVLYAFTESQEAKDMIRERTMSGNLVYNDTFMQLSVNEIPFGGVGESGYGRQILRYSFNAFTYERASMDMPTEYEPLLGNRYPPYTAEKLKVMSGMTFLQIPGSDPVKGLADANGVNGGA